MTVDMSKKASILFILLTLTWVGVPQIVFACGCGLALTNEDNYQSLQEPEAYLVVKAFDKKTFEIQPYFRLYSDKPSIGTIPIVFPIDQIPATVTGKKITAYDFQKMSGIQDALTSHSKLIDAKEKIHDSIINALPGVEQGILSTSFLQFLRSSVAGSVGGAAGGLDTDIVDTVNPVAHFEFEGGNLDVFNPATMGTLEKFASTFQGNLASSVKKMVEKYKNSYIAVLHLDIPSTTTELGNLVSMRFENTNHFFYPTSLTSAYARPVPNLGYYINTPKNLQPKLVNAKTDWSVSIGDRRIYRVHIPETLDLRGTFTGASLFSYIDDALRYFTFILGKYSFILGTLIFWLLTIFIVISLKFDQKIGARKRFLITFGILYILGGLFFLFPAAFIMRRWRLGVLYMCMWVAMLLPTLFWFLRTMEGSGIYFY